MRFDRFVVAAGTMPCHCTLMDSTGAPLYQYGAAHRNTISWSPHGRFLCLAGFGNLAGEMDFYDTLRSKKIGKSNNSIGLCCDGLTHSTLVYIIMAASVYCNRLCLQPLRYVPRLVS